MATIAIGHEAGRPAGGGGWIHGAFRGMTIAAAIAAVTAGCARSAPVAGEPPRIPLEAVSAPPALHKSAWSSVPTALGGYWVHFVPPPQQFPFNEGFDLEVRVTTDAAGLEGASIDSLNVDATMPQHGHGMFSLPKVERLEPGRFRVLGLQLHMTGKWLLTFDVMRRGLTERAQLRIEIE